MKISNRNIKQFTFFVVILIVVSAFVVFAISWALNKKGWALPWFISGPSISGVYLLIFELYDKYLWRTRPFRWLSGISSPDLNGEWKGYVNSSYDDFKKSYDIHMFIKQSATNVIVRAAFGQSKSVSINAGFEPSDIDGCDALFYFYRNEPNPDAKKSMAMHEGSTKLVYNSKEDTLEGNYYSGRDRNNFGTIHLERMTD